MAKHHVLHSDRYTANDYPIRFYRGDEEGDENPHGKICWATCEQLGCRSEGKTFEEAEQECKIAMNAMLEVKDEMGFERPKPIF